MENFGLGKIGEKIARQALQATTDHHETIAQDVRHELIENTVTKSNFLARSSYEFSLVDKRVMEMMISKLNPVGMKLNIYQTVEITLHASDYAKAASVPKNIAYRDLKNSIKALLHTVITTEENKHQVMRPLMFSAKYQESEGYIIASFHPEFLPHLIGLREQFTKYALEDVMKFKSEYTWRIYEMCMSVRNTKEKTISISVVDFRKRLAIPESYIWSRIKEVIERAKLEIESKTDYNLNVINKKTSKTFTHLEFKLEKETKKMIEDIAEIQRLNQIIERAISVLEQAESDTETALKILKQTQSADETASELLHLFL